MTTSQPFDGQHLLDSINNIVRHAVQPALRIQQLGNGAAFLHLLKQIHPEVVQADRIIGNPADVHEVTHNLRLLAAAFDQAQLKCKIDVNVPSIQIQKLAQMKYNENYHIAAFLMKMVTDKRENVCSMSSGVDEECRERLLQFKVTVRDSPKPKRIMKEEPASITINDICALRSMSRHLLQPIGSKELKIFPSRESKLTKIASILQICSKTRSQFSQKCSKGKIATLESSFCVLSLNDSPAIEESESQNYHRSQISFTLSGLPQPVYESWSEMQQENEEYVFQCEKMECETVCFGQKYSGTSSDQNNEQTDCPSILQPWPPKNPFSRYFPRLDVQ